MARRKRKGGRRRGGRRGKKSRGYAKAMPAGAAVGGLVSLGTIALDPDSITGFSPVEHVKMTLKGTSSIDSTLRSTKEALKTLDNYKWFALGVGVSASKKVPGIRLVARPIDSVLKSMSKGKWGL